MTRPARAMNDRHGRRVRAGEDGPGSADPRPGDRPRPPELERYGAIDVKAIVTLTSLPQRRDPLVPAEIVLFAISDGQMLDLLAVKTQDGQLWGVLFRMCEAIELFAQDQIERCRERSDWLTGDIPVELSPGSQTRSVFCIGVQARWRSATEPLC